MKPMLNSVDAPRNVPRDLQSRLYREIGISAVAAALNIADGAPLVQPVTRQDRPTVGGRKAA